MGLNSHYCAAGIMRNNAWLWGPEQSTWPSDLTASINPQTQVVKYGFVCMKYVTSKVWITANGLLTCCFGVVAELEHTEWFSPWGLIPGLWHSSWNKITWQSLCFCSQSLVTHPRSTFSFSLVALLSSLIPTPLWKPCCCAGGPTASWPFTPPWRTPTWSLQSSEWWGPSNICAGILGWPAWTHTASALQMAPILAKTCPTVNVFLYALGNENYRGGIWQFLTGEKIETPQLENKTK